MPCTPLLLAALALAPPSPALLPDDAPVHLGIVLAATHADELAALRRGQQDPTSPDFRRWLTPEEYGARFGQPAARYAAIEAWLRAHGFAVTESPNRTFIGALGTAGQVAKLAGVHLRHVAGQPAGVHVADGAPRFPPEFSSAILHVAGLDTRVHYHHLLAESSGWPPALGPQDLRRFYDLAPLFDAGYVGQRQQLVVLGEAEPPATAISPQAIDYFLQNVSDARASLILDALPNPQADYDPGGGGNQEFEPDVELQSVGSPGADSITLVLSPASEVFITGANEIVNNHSTATAVSVSLGLCEQYEEAEYASEATSFQQLLIQGTTEGQTWSAATGDSGSDDCGDGVTESVDWPASLPEIVAMGGSQITNPVFDANNAIMAYQQEVVWNTNDPQEPGAAGGGISELYGVPAYQDGLVTGGRSVPDLVLLAGNPGVAADSSNPFLPLASNYFVSAPMAAQLSSFEGTSAASPLSAGFFALIASRVGCRLGDPHAAMYSLGRGQFDGGPIVYNAITQGTVATDGVPGPTAGVGYNSASGWGSFDVAAMAAAWPPCPPLDAGYGFDGGIQAEASYSQCAFIACDAGTPCVTLPEGPASCEIPCSATQACGPDYLCTPGTIFADAGLCVLGCATDADCGPDGGVCNSCEETCVPPGAADAGVGIACASPLDCPTSGLCLTYDMSGNQWLDGYCTLICNTPGDTAVCSCPAGSVCDYAMGLCMQSCPTPGPSGCRSGYVCQPDGDGTSSCQVPCSLAGGIDSCSASETPDLSCDLNSGVCGGPVPLPDGGSDAGAVADAGHAAPDAGPAVQDAGPAASDGGDDAGAPTPAADAGASADAGAAASKSSGCNCGAGAEAGDLPLLLGALFSLSRRRRKLTRG